MKLRKGQTALQRRTNDGLEAGVYDIVECDDETKPLRLVRAFRWEDYPSRAAALEAAEQFRAAYREIADLTPVGLQEIAAMLGVRRQSVDNWRTKGVLPTPRWTVGGRPAWARGDIALWAEETGRQTVAPSG